MATRTLVAATLAAIMSATTAIAPVTAQELAPLWKTFPKWEVRVDHNLGYGCFMQALYEPSNTTLRIGFNASNQNGYFEIVNLAWDSLVVGTDLTVMLSFDNAEYKPWTGRVVTLTTGHRGIYFPTSNTRFWAAVAATSVIDIRYNGQLVLRGQMLGSAQALAGVAECQQAFAQTKAPADPFRSTGPARAVDPFKTL